jgi:hypothetical protein
MDMGKNLTEKYSIYVTEGNIGLKLMQPIGHRGLFGKLWPEGLGCPAWPRPNRPMGGGLTLGEIAQL